MEHKCLTCKFYEATDGASICTIDGNNVDPESAPRFAGGNCWSKVKKMPTAELSRIRSLAGSKGGRARRRTHPKIQRMQMQVAKMDCEVIRAYAETFTPPRTLVSTVHFLARYILQEHPNIKKPKGWIDEL